MKTPVQTAIALAIAAALMTGPAVAGERRARDGYVDYAKVVNVEPITRIVRVAQPRQECWDEPVTHHRTYRDDGASYTPSILGGILGGVVGNRFGQGTGRDVMTVAGTVLGASVGRDVNRSNSYRDSSYTTVEQRCETRNVYREVEQSDGYRVTYRYNGREYVRHMDYDPGERVRVEVSVAPVER